MWVATGLILPISSTLFLSAPRVEPPGTEAAAPTCDTLFDPGPDGDWTNVDNWTNGLPRAQSVTCFPPEASALAQAWPGIARVVQPRRQINGTASTGIANLHPDPPPPTTLGVCCLGSTCVQSDYFDCLNMDGSFRSNVLTCDFNPCASGVCCDGNPPVCLDEDLGGDPMDEEVCGLTGGDYLGGAACDASDPCQRVRIPAGFEIIEVTPGMEGLLRRHPRMNNCGEVVVHIGTESSSWQAEIYKYDNGALGQLTQNDVYDNFPDVNDGGTLVWNRWNEDLTNEGVLYALGGQIVALDNSNMGLGAPRINNLAHAAWSHHISPSCPGPRRDAIFHYNGQSSSLVFDNQLSNQSPAINDLDNILVATATLECGGSSDDWSADVLLIVQGHIIDIPEVLFQSGVPTLNNADRMGWAGTDQVEPLVELFEGGSSRLLQGRSGGPDVNNDRDTAYHWKTAFSPWHQCLDRDSKTFWLSNDADIVTLIDNNSGTANDLGEITWKWNPNGGFVPSGTRLMRRIRNGDVTFDGVVDIDDFIPLPGCWTGPGEMDGLCECRFFDIDHDRDIDDDDFALFMRVYEGPQEDCNTNGVLDLTDLIEGTSADCNLNGVPDLCDVASGTSSDVDGDGNLDECCAVAPTVTTDTLGARNRYLTVITDPSVSAPVAPDGFTYIRHAPPISYALRVTVDDMPPGLEEYEGTTLWAGTPQEICENSGQGLSVPPDQCGPAPGPNDRTMWVARLVCGEAQAHYTDWSELGTVHLYHQTVVPEGSYSVQSILSGCGTALAGNFSAALPLTQAQWGDVVSDVTQCPMGPPNNDTDVLGDVVSLVQKFSNLPCAPTKARADLEPGSVDFVINFTDVLEALQAFTGAGYPFTPSVGPCS